MQAGVLTGELQSESLEENVGVKHSCVLATVLFNILESRDTNGRLVTPGIWFPLLHLQSSVWLKDRPPCPREVAPSAMSLIPSLNSIDIYTRPHLGYGSSLERMRQ